jgi:hypothetical protein
MKSINLGRKQTGKHSCMIVEAKQANEKRVDWFIRPIIVRTGYVPNLCCKELRGYLAILSSYNQPNPFSQKIA